MVRAFVAVWNRANVAVHHLILEQAPADLTHFSPAHCILAGMVRVHFQQEQVWRALASSRGKTGHSPPSDSSTACLLP
jgi:hypothetical protein